ncbi:MAG: GNAT family N-acetyltransferase [Candidatus Dormibacteraceae bacterium]
MALTFERLPPDQLDLIRPLLLDLELEEQPHFAGHPQATREQLARSLPGIAGRFHGENVVFVAREEAEGTIAAFCWVVLFDPGTGLEGEVAEVFVRPGHRGERLGETLVARAVELFRERGVTLGYVWTRHQNEPAVRLYRGAGFAPTDQLILTWYPDGDGAAGGGAPL